MKAAPRRSRWLQRVAALVSLGIAITGCAEIIGADFDVALVVPRCGDHICNGGEVATGEESCPEDCEPRCGDGICDSNENECLCEADCTQTGCPDGCCGYGGDFGEMGEITCPADCQLPCGDGVCDPDAGESCATCHADCFCLLSEECRADPTRSVRDQCRARDGQRCETSAECGSNNCVGGICCNVPCGLCNACAADGSQCGPLVEDAACPGTSACVAGKCQCADGVEDGNETGIDCGGDCGPCQ